jgi:hypothetical protein
LPGDTKPNAVDPAGRDLYLCHGCRTRNWADNIETKDGEAEQQRQAGRRK